MEFSRRGLLRGTSLAALMLYSSSCANAGINNPGTAGSAVVAAVGKAQLNLGAGDIGPQIFINALHAWQPTFQGGATPAALDIYGFPIANFTGAYDGQIIGTDGMGTTGPWVILWDGGRNNAAFKFTMLSSATVSASSHCTFVNGAGSGNFAVIGDGSGIAGSITFTLPITATIAVAFDGAGSYAVGSGRFGMIRASDLAAYNNGEHWTPEFINLLKGLKPKSLRPMGWVLSRFSSAQSNEVKWAYRCQPSSISWNTLQYPPRAWAGTISNSGIAYTAPAAPDTPLTGWVANEVILGNITNGYSTPISISGAVAGTGGKIKLTVPSTAGLSPAQKILVTAVQGTSEANGIQTINAVDDATHVTINTTFVNTYTGSGIFSTATLAVTGKAGGAKLIANNLGGAIGGGFAFDQTAIVAGLASFFYDGILDVVVYTSGGISGYPPMEAMSQLCNRVNTDLWFNIPGCADDDYVTQAANTAFNNLSSNLKFKVELSNENWNNGFVGFFMFAARGTTLGLGGAPNLAYESLRVRQIMGNLLPASSWSAALSRLKRHYCFQWGSGYTDTSIFTTYMTGSTLAVLGLGYNSSPNRPCDVITTVGYAPYLSALSLAQQSTGAPVATDAPFLQSVADNYSAGGAGITTAIAQIDTQVNSGRNSIQTVTASGTTFTTPLAHGYVFGDGIQFSASGGTAYSGINTKSFYYVASTPTGTTFTIHKAEAGLDTGPIDAGSAGTGTMNVGRCGYDSYTFQSATYGKWEAAVESFNSGSVPILGSMTVEWYEGALTISGPTTATCTALGILVGGSAAAASAAIASAIVAWKNDPSASPTLQRYYKAFMGTDPTSVTFGVMPQSVSPSQLVLFGGGLYALIANVDVSAPQKYQLYNGFAAFSSA